MCIKLKKVYKDISIYGNGSATQGCYKNHWLQCSKHPKNQCSKIEVFFSTSIWSPVNSIRAKTKITVEHHYALMKKISAYRLVTGVKKREAGLRVATQVATSLT